jgi:hypothetical protein
MTTKPSNWYEPESAFNEDQKSEYPYNNITQSESGHTFEMDDTPGRERVRLQHRTETFLEMHPNGDQVIKVQGNSYEITIKDKNILVKGQCNITVEGSAVFDIKGDKIERIQGNYTQVVEGNYQQLVKKESRMFSGGDMHIKADPLLNGRMFLGAGQITVYSDFTVDGEVAAQKVSAKTRVDAGLGISAGPMGFVTLTGGIAVGPDFPIAIPGCIHATGLITSTTVVAAPLGGFGVMGAVLMTDVVNKSIYNTHIHGTFRGPTGPPISPMVG